MVAVHWPATLRHDEIELRPLRVRDERAWREVRKRNAEWLAPWDASLPPEGSAEGETPPSFGAMVRRLRREARAGHIIPWALTYRGQLAGQVTVGGIAWGSLRGGYIGYWIDSALAGRGIMPTAVAMACDFCFETLKLHRIEVNIRPENTASLRVAEKLGLRYEGERPAYLHIDGAWRDHRTFVLLRDEIPGGVLARYLIDRADAAS